MSKLVPALLAACLLAACDNDPPAVPLTSPPDSGPAACGACPAHQLCNAARGACVCDNACVAGGPACDPSGSGLRGDCVTDAVGCPFVANLATCPGAGQSCAAGATACACAAAPACTAPASRCNPAGTGSEDCGTDATGCAAWVPLASCTSPRVCDPAKVAAGTQPPCSCPPASCTVGDERCGVSGEPERCVSSGTCTADWVGQGACSAASEACTEIGASPTRAASCACKEPACTAAGQKLCEAAAREATCAADPGSNNGCFTSTGADCPSSRMTCVSGTGCACTNQICDPGTFVPSCSGSNTLLSCRPDTGGCGDASSTNCDPGVGAGSTCVPAGATPAHCSCPAPSGNTLVVDAVGGDNANGTGSSALGCAYKSITRALAKPGVGTTFTVIQARRGTYSTATTTEAFPIRLPARVTLTTSGTGAFVIRGGGAITLTPGPGGITSAVVATDAGTATLENFTVDGTVGAVVASDAFACNAGAVLLSGVVLTGAERGAGLYGNCAATLSGTTSTLNRRVGIRAASSRPVAIGNHTSVLDDDGLEHNSGVLTVNILEVDRAQGAFNGGGDGITIVPANRGATTPPDFAGVDLGVHDGQGEGFRVRSGAFAIGGVAVSGSSFQGNQGMGVRLQHGPSLPGLITFHGVEVSGNASEGVECDVNRVSGGHAARFTDTRVLGNCAGGGCPGFLVSSGRCELGGDGSTVTVEGNDGDGIEVAGGGPTVFEGTDVVVAGNTQNGVLVDVAGGDSFTCAGCRVAGNAEHGYLVSGAPSVGGFVLRGGRVSANGAPGGVWHGIYLEGSNDNVIAGISGLEVDGNSQGAGLFFSADVSNATAVVSGCDIHGNGAVVSPGGGLPANLRFGGLVTDGRVNLTFVNNRVHANRQDGIAAFDFSGVGGVNVGLGAVSCATPAPARPNEFYCYGAGNVGVAAYDGAVASAVQDRWSQATPAAGVDYRVGAVSGGGNGTVNTAGACNAVATACP